jgi:molybdopterin converting factor small subunit
MKDTIKELENLLAGKIEERSKANNDIHQITEVIQMLKDKNQKIKK